MARPSIGLVLDNGAHQHGADLNLDHGAEIDTLYQAPLPEVCAVDIRLVPQRQGVYGMQ